MIWDLHLTSSWRQGGGGRKPFELQMAVGTQHCMRERDVGQAHSDCAVYLAAISRVPYLSTPNRMPPSPTRGHRIDITVSEHLTFCIYFKLGLRRDMRLGHASPQDAPPPPFNNQPNQNHHHLSHIFVGPATKPSVYPLAVATPLNPWHP